MKKLNEDKLDKLLTHVGDISMKRRAKMIVEELELKSEDKVLDIGCGDGFHLHLLSNLDLSLKLTGFDVNRDSQKVSRSKLKGKKQFCLTCQKEYYVSLADLKRKSDKYCSKKCYGVAVSKRQLGINNHHYKHGLSNTKEYKNQLQYNNRAKRKEAIGQFTIEEWQLLKEQYNFTCHMCNKSEPEIKLTVDHIIPLTKNGTNFISNIQPLCKSCNSRKSNKIISRINICQKLDRAVDQVILEH